MSGNSIPRRRLVNLYANQDVDQLLGPPALVPGEDPAVYQNLLQRIRQAINPRDMIEQFWARDITDLLWEVLRYRRYKAKLLASSAHKGAQSVLEPILGPVVSESVSGDWFSGKASAIKTVDTHLARAKLDREAIIAQTFSSEIDTIERLDRMLAAAELRLIAIVREMDRRRQIAVESVVSEIEDTDYEEVTDSPTGPHEQRRANRG